MAEASDNDRVLSARLAVDAYREAHRQLHAGGWYEGISEDHTPLLEKLMDDLRKSGFSSLGEFFTSNDELNLQELGFSSREEFKVEVRKGSRLLRDIISPAGDVVIGRAYTPEGETLMDTLAGMWR